MKHQCTRCERELAPGTEVWLEFDTNVGLYFDPEREAVGKDWSQGVFPFGSACAKKELAYTEENRVIEGTQADGAPASFWYNPTTGTHE